MLNLKHSHLFGHVLVKLYALEFIGKNKLFLNAVYFGKPNGLIMIPVTLKNSLAHISL